MDKNSPPPTADSNTSWFGFRPVDPAQKTGLVRDVFNRVAKRYDLMNDLMSLGVHRLWKADFIQQINPMPGQILLDVAGGTGDIALAFLKEADAKTKASDQPAKASVCDINTAMMTVGRDRAIDQGRLKNLNWITGNAEQLPLPDRSVDVCTIAFGLRNVTHRSKALKEFYRVLKPGGRFYCLEFSHVHLPLLNRLYDTYSFSVLPRLGAWVAQDKEAYTYLVESIRKFPDQETLKKECEHAGFHLVKWRNLSGGIAAVHWGWRV